MAKLVIIYGTGYGQTRKISEYIADRARGRGHDVQVLHGKELSPDFSLGGADAVVIGASLHMQKHQKYIARFVAVHRDELARIPSAFFSVSMSAASPEGRSGAQRCVDAFEREAGWHPSRVALFAGELAYTRYNFLVRWVMRKISQSQGGSTDTSRDHEYTDWAAVDRFTDEFLASLPLQGPGVRAQPSLETPAPAP